MKGKRVSRGLNFKAGFSILSSSQNLSFPQVVDKLSTIQKASLKFHQIMVNFMNASAISFYKNSELIILQRSVKPSGN